VAVFAFPLHGTNDFRDCKSMGELTAEHISLMLGV
jgi:hypothetical protein